MKKFRFSVKVDFTKNKHPLSIGEKQLIINTLESSREYKNIDEAKSVRAMNLAYNYMRKRGLTPKETIEDTLRLMVTAM